MTAIDDQNCSIRSDCQTLRPPVIGRGRPRVPPEIDQFPLAGKPENPVPFAIGSDENGAVWSDVNSLTNSRSLPSPNRRISTPIESNSGIRM